MLCAHPGYLLRAHHHLDLMQINQTPAEGIPGERIFLTGNTVIDALEFAVRQAVPRNRFRLSGPPEPQRARAGLPPAHRPQERLLDPAPELPALRGPDGPRHPDPDRLGRRPGRSAQPGQAGAGESLRRRPGRGADHPGALGAWSEPAKS